MRKEDWKITDIIIAHQYNELILLCFEIIITVPPIVYLYRKYPLSLFHVEKANKIVQYSFVGLLVSVIINASLLRGPFNVSEEYDFLLTSNISTKLSYLLIACLVAPIIEEIFFRGLIYRILKHRYDIVTATVVGAGIFVLAHAFGGYDGNALFVVALSGLLFIYVYEKSGSLLTSMITHSLYNSVWFYFVHLGVQ
jgi:membrane protease YdiL (CAAX protease family)